MTSSLWLFPRWESAIIGKIHPERGEEFQNTMLQNRIIVITGHYGSGKTNLSVNLAVDLKKQGKEVTLVDLDIVNPYFRSADFRDFCQEQGIELLAPLFANSNLDIPALSTPVIGKLRSENTTVILDVGGDSAGAAALGQYAQVIKDQGYDLLYVVNFYRYLTRSPKEAAEILGEIQGAGRLAPTGLVNNSNLSTETTWKHLEDIQPQMEELSSLTGLPIAFTAVKRDLAGKVPEGLEKIYPIDVYVKAPWNEE